MQPVKTRSGFEKHEPYPLGDFPESVIHELGKHIVHLKAVGQTNLGGDEFCRSFAAAIDGTALNSPLGIADVTWNGCCWSVKTLQASTPHVFTVGKHKRPKIMRLISGRNSPSYSAGIHDPFNDIQATGTAVINIYNSRISESRTKHNDVRLLVFIRNMKLQEFTIFERAIVPIAARNYVWKSNAGNNLEAYEGKRHSFTWQPHGSQFTILEQIPAGATRFRIAPNNTAISMDEVLTRIGFSTDWIEIIS